MVTCPNCHTPQPPDSVLCPSCFLPIEHHDIGPSPDPDAPPSGPSPSAPRQCTEPTCVFQVLPGQSSCMGGHRMAPQPSSDSSETSTAIALLPDGQRIALAPGVPVELGRQSSHPQVRDALLHHDVVSRRHAVVTLNGAVLTIRHLGTTNPTFANDQQVTHESRVPLPVRIRLGETVAIEITKGT